MTPRVAALVAAVAVGLAGCTDGGEAPARAQESPSVAAVETSTDHGPEIVDGILYPPGVAVGESGAIGRTRTGWTVSGGGNSGSLFGSVAVYSDDGVLVTEGHDVLGVALSDPTGDLAAWVEARNDGDVRHLVVVDTSTGDQLLRRALGGGSVAAVWGDEVLVTGDHRAGMGGRTYALTPNGFQEPLSFAEGDTEDYLVWGYDGEYVAYGDFETTVTVADRDGSNSHDYDAAVGFLSPGTGKIALLTADGLEVADLESGDRTPLPVEDPSISTQWTPSGDLVVWTGGFFGDGAHRVRYLCLGGTEDCRLAPATHPGQEVAVTPADALMNLFGELS